MSYQIGVDVGATFTTVAVVRGGRAEVVQVVPSQLPGVPRGFLRRVGDETPVLVGARPVPAETLVAQLVRQAVSAAGNPARLAVTHPVTWGPHRVAALRAALGEVTMLSTAAAVAYGSKAPVAVHDLGGSSFTAAVVRGLATVGQPVELDLGGADLDELVFDHVRAAVSVPDDPAALVRLRQACVAAKEALSSDTEVEVLGVRLTRAEFEEMARPLLTETAAAFRMAIEESGVTPATVLLAGGAAWLPLLTQVVSEELGRPVTSTPPGAAAMGAALAAGDVSYNGFIPSPAGVSGPPAALGSATPSTVGAAVPSAAPRTRSSEPRTTLAEPVRPPVPAVAAPNEEKPQRSRRTIAVAAAALAVVGAAVGITLTRGQTPAGAGAETVPTTTTVSTTVPTTTTTIAPPPPQKQQPKAPQNKKPQKTQPTTKTTTTTTTTEPTETTTTTEEETTTTTVSTKGARSPETTERGDR